MAEGTAASGRIVPHDNSAEQAFLGALLIEPSAINEGIALVSAEDFFSQRHRTLYEAILNLHGQHIEIDTVTLGNYLKDQKLFQQSGGIEYINELLDATPTAANIKHYAGIIRDKAVLRGLIQTASSISEMAYDPGRNIDEITNEAESTLFKITDRNITQSYEKIQDIIHRTFSIIKSYKQDGFSGLPTGFSGLDNLTSGFLPGQLIIIAGRPGSGKTAFCLNMATRVAQQTQRPILFFSLEMRKEELVMRMLCSEAKMDNTKLKKGLFSQREMTSRLIPAADRLFSTKIIIDEKSDITVMEAMAKARRIKNEYGDLALVIFDYMQLVEGPPGIPKGERYAIISEVSRSLKYLSKELSVPVIALSQLSREIEKRTTHRPQLADLRESGQIEQDADIVAFINRPYLYTENEEEKNIAELIVAKHRNGATGSIPLAFFGEYMRFEDRASE